jgi:D-ribose pyranase
MLKSGILNPALNSLISRVRHTNTLVIADRGFPSWKQVETVDLSLVDDVPRVLDVLAALLPNFQCGCAYIAEEFGRNNTGETVGRLRATLGSIRLVQMPHTELKQLVPAATGLIRTGDTIPYANIILESA